MKTFNFFGISISFLGLMTAIGIVVLNVLMLFFGSRRFVSMSKNK